MLMYLNGNYLVKLEGDGTKRFTALRCNEQYAPEFPDSIDIKITDRCSWGCPFCHESSGPGGDEFDLRATCDLLSTLPGVGIELAIGGGNLMEMSDHSVLLEFLTETQNMGFQNRITLNANDFKVPGNLEIIEKLQSLIGGMGISVGADYDIDDIVMAMGSTYFTRNKVFHVIAGIGDLGKLRELLLAGPVLVLGYKQWGRAYGTEIPTLDSWRKEIQKLLYMIRSTSLIPGTLSFDNLALEQLEITDSLLGYEYDELFMGREFSHSMYIDAVKKEFAPTSRSEIRDPWEDWEYNIPNYFKHNRIDHD